MASQLRTTDGAAISPHHSLVTQLRSLAVAEEFARTVAEVVRPLVGSDGAPAFLWRGCSTSLWPTVNGEPLDRADPQLVRDAARLLARLHRAAWGWPLAARPAHLPHGTDTDVRTSLPDAELDDWLRAWRPGDHAAGWRHGDFFAGNLLCRGGRIVGVIDWDDVSWGPLVEELAWSVWEFAKTPSGTRLRIDRARMFLAEYRRTGGPVCPSDDIVRLIRARLREDVAFWRRVRPDDHAEDRAKVAALASLRELRPDCLVVG